MASIMVHVKMRKEIKSNSNSEATEITNWLMRFPGTKTKMLNKRLAV